MTAEELADEEWGPVKEKKGKGKKGKGKAKKDEDETESAAVEEVKAVEKPSTPTAEILKKDPEEPNAEGVTVLSKKEKERLKKERDKVRGPSCLRERLLSPASLEY